MSIITVKIFDGLSSKPQVGILTLVSKTHFHLAFEGHQAQHEWKDTSLSMTGSSWTVRLQVEQRELEFAIPNPKEHFPRGRPPMVRGSVNARATSISWLWWLVAGLGTISASVAFYILWLPSIVYSVVDRLPTSIDEDLSKLSPVLAFMEERVDSAATATLSEYLNTIDLGMERTINPVVVQSEVNNAFAMPNGDIVIFSGIIQNMESHEALAGLIAHEAAHVENRHAIKSIAQAYTGLTILSLLVGDISSITTILFDNAQQLHQLSYSREFEMESDAFALDVLERHQMSSEPMQQLFESFNHHGDEDFKSYLDDVEILMTHPNTEKRIDALTSDHEILPDNHPDQILRLEIFNRLKDETEFSPEDDTFFGYSL